MSFIKSITYLITLFTFASVTGQQVQFPQDQPNQLTSPVYIEGIITGAKSLTISLGGQNVKPQSIVATAFTDEEGKFVLRANIPFPDYYYLRLQNGQMLNLVLFGGDSIQVYGNADQMMTTSNIVGSPSSAAINEFMGNQAVFKGVEDSLKNVIKKDPTKGEEVNAYFGKYAPSFYDYRNLFIQQWGGSPAIIATLSAIDQEKEWLLFTQVVDALSKSFGSSPTVVNLLNYKNQKLVEKEATAFLAPGNPAKEIAMQNPAGDTLKLSDLKGKIVLLDFWASWCRPCRAENPNVVKLYSKYNKDGFEVFSVSLDGNKAAWEKAIEVDGLVWPYHVSDLKKWANVAAKDYGVKGIPFTVLIDREGKIIATKLRGVALENQLKTIFGY